MKRIVLAVLLSFAASPPAPASDLFEWLFPAAVEAPVNSPKMSLPESETRGAPGDPRASDPRCKRVGTEWAWFSDHVAASVTYVVQAPNDRQYEVGTGVSMFGKPRGRISRGSGKSEVTAYGAGAIHVRTRDGKGPSLVCVAQGDLREITFIDQDY